MNVMPLNCTSNQSNNRQSFGMNFSESAKGALNNYVEEDFSKITPKIVESCKKLSAKKDSFEITDIKCCTNKRTPYSPVSVSVRDLNDGTEVVFKNSQDLDAGKGLFKIIKSLLNDFTLNSKFTAQRTWQENNRAIFAHAQLMRASKELDKVVNEFAKIKCIDNIGTL